MSVFYHKSLEPGTLFIGDRLLSHVLTRELMLIVSGPNPDSKLNIHKVYNFRSGTITPFMPNGFEEILG